MKIRQIMIFADRYLNDNDLQLAVFILRDTSEVAEAGLYGLACAMHRDGSLHYNDVIYFLSQLCEYLDGIGQ